MKVIGRSMIKESRYYQSHEIKQLWDIYMKHPDPATRDKIMSIALTMSHLYDEREEKDRIILQQKKKMTAKDIKTKRNRNGKRL